MGNRIIRLLIVTALMLPLAFLAAAAGQASELPPDIPATECEECHEVVQRHWEESAHAHAVENPRFQQAWDEEGRPSECFACHTTGYDPATGVWDVSSVSCTTCHYPVPGNHPDQIMPTDVSSRLCGGCHLETYSDWNESVHAQEDLACIRCHSPHTNTVRTEDALALCSACHAEQVHFYTYTAHYEEGLLCVDCHVQVVDQPLGQGHEQRRHSFAVDMATCAECHEDQMHFPSLSGGDGGGGMSDLLNVNDPQVASMQPTPDPVSPLGFALVATLIGAALGMILAPWSEQWYRRIRA